MLELLQMWVLVECLGVLCLPLTFTVFRNLPDRGWAFSKALGLIVFAFCVWLLLMSLRFLPYSSLFLLSVMLILTACSVLAFFKLYRDIVGMLRRHIAYIALTELVFFGMMLLLGILRSFKPDIHNFEMFMDEGFVSSIMRSPHFPPNDMWYAGYSINYYYYAHYTIATLAKLLGQSSSVAFNTGICLFYGLTALNLFGVTCNIVAQVRNHRQQKLIGLKDTVFPHLLAATPYGFISVLMALVLGNLAATQQWWSEHGEVGYRFNWFAPSRVIDHTINEFPAFSFILSCFHAHVLTLAFTILCIGVAFNWFLESSGKGLDLFGTGWQKYLNFCVTAVVVGGLFVMNGWDYPTYMGLIFVCILLQQGLAYGWSLCLALFFDCVKVAGSVISLSFIFYLPFYRSFTSPSKGIGIVTLSNHSPLSGELLIYGLFIFIFLSLLIGSVLKPLRSDPALFAAIALPALPSERITDEELPLMTMLEPGVHARKCFDEYGDGAKKVISVQVCATEKVEPLLAINPIGKRLLVFGTEFGICFFLLGCLVILFYQPVYTTCIAALSLALVGFVLMFQHIGNRAWAFTLLLGVTAFALIAGCEIFFLKDLFADGDAQRMNTIFKFYFQAWALLSICSGAGLFFILEGFRSWKPSSRTARWLARGLIGLWGCALLILVSASMVFPLLSPATRYEHIENASIQPDFVKNASTLDGMTYLASCHEPDCDYDTSGDYAAIHWLNEHIQGAPVLVEANGDDYHYNGRVSVFTGLPTIINWAGHELQWRVNWIKDKHHPSHEQDFSNRGIAVDTIYIDAQSASVLKTMARYHAQYVYVGTLEHKKYPNVNLERFGSFMHTVYHQSDVTIYQMK